MTFVAPAEPLSASYTIDVQLDPEQKRVSGTGTIRLMNRSALTLKTLALAWYSEPEGSFTVKVGGIAPRLSSPTPYEFGNVTQVSLPEPLSPGETVELSVTFSSYRPHEVYGAWPVTFFHPKLFWGYPVQDNYAVRIEVPAGWMLAVSGRAGDGGVWQAKGVRDFGIMVSADYQVMEATAGDTLIRCLYRPAGKGCADLLLKTAVDAMNYYREEFGAYPYTFFTIIPGMDRVAGGGPLATAIVAIHGEERFAEAPADHWRWIVAHEIGHQYWGECVMDADQPDWLWIGLGIYMDRAYTRARGLAKNHREYFTGEYLEGVKEGVDTTLARCPDDMADLPFDYNNIVMHGKGYSVISALEAVLGTETFRRVYQQCLQQCRGKRLGVQAFREFCEQQTGEDLGWFFSQWVFSNRQLAYRIASVNTEAKAGRYTTRVTVERTGTLQMPVPVEVRFVDGSVQRASTNRLSQVSELVFESAAPLTEAVLDPDQALPLRDQPVYQPQLTIHEDGRT